MSKFQVGDRVELVYIPESVSSEWVPHIVGALGTVANIYPSSFGVRWDKNIDCPVRGEQEGFWYMSWEFNDSVDFIELYIDDNGIFEVATDEELDIFMGGVLDV